MRPQLTGDVFIHEMIMREVGKIGSTKIARIIEGENWPRA